MEETHKKNELLKGLFNIDGYEVNIDKLDLSNSQDIEMHIEKLKYKHMKAIDESNVLKKSVQSIENELKIREKMNENQRRLNSKPEVIKARKELIGLREKRDKLENNIFAMKVMINQTEEELSLTKEDLMSKLLQRADFVAQREELDEVYESYKKWYGDDFRYYCMLQEKNTYQTEEQYKFAKNKSFYIDILDQLKTFSMSKESLSDTSSELDTSNISIKTPYVSQIDLLIKKLNKGIEIDNIEQTICALSKNLGLSLNLKVLLKKREQVSLNTDDTFAEKYK